MIVCAGSLFGEFGHAYIECSRRHECERAARFDIESSNGEVVSVRTGRACSSDDKEEFIKITSETSLELNSVAVSKRRKL